MLASLLYRQERAGVGCLLDSQHGTTPPPDLPLHAGGGGKRVYANPASAALNVALGRMAWLTSARSGW